MATINPGDEVIVPAPYWTSYIDLIKIAGGHPVIVPCTEQNGFKMVPAQLKAALSKRTKWILFNSPSNPSGAVYSEADYQPLLNILLDHPDVWIMGLVKAELEANLQSLQSVVGTREGGLAAYNDALAELSETQELPNSLPQLQFPEITNIAYRIATDAGVIAEIDPTELLIIAQAYEAIQEVESNRSFLDNRNAQIRYEDDEQFLSGFIYYSNRALVSEPAAINAVGRALSVM